MSFTARRITSYMEGEALPAKLIYRHEEIEQLRAGTMQIENARKKAQQLIDAAQRQAEAHERCLKEQCEARLHAADAALLKRATALEAHYRHCREALLRDIEATLDAALSDALHRIALALPAVERIRIVEEALRTQVGCQDVAQLFLCSEDAAACAQARLPLRWPASIDDTLQPGECRLVTTDGEWTLAFDALIESLLECRMSS